MQDPTAELATAMAQPTRAEQAKALGDVLNRIPDFSHHVRELRQRVVKEMHDDEELSWAEIGEAIGQHRTRAAQIARGVPGGVKKRPAKNGAPPTD